MEISRVLMEGVFQPSPNVLGLVIYGTELLLWIGVFSCGGYYQFRPWIRQKLKSKRSEEVVVVNDAVMHDLPSSTSVFRTPSQVESLTRRDAGGRNTVEIA